MRVVAVVSELMFASRVTTLLEAAGHEVARVSAPEDVSGNVDVIIVDLTTVEPEAVADARYWRYAPRSTPPRTACCLRGRSCRVGTS